MAFDIGVSIGILGAQAYITSLSGAEKATVKSAANINRSITGISSTFEKTGARSIKSFSGTGVAIRGFSQDLASTANPLRTLGAASTAFSSTFSKGMSSAKRSLDELKNDIPALGAAFSVLKNPITIAAASVTALGVGFKNAVDTAKVFQQQLADTAAIVGIERTDEAFSGLTQTARELGATTEFTATEAAKAMEELARAGFDVNQILEGTPATLALATAGNLDLAKAADIATNILGQYGKEAKELGSVVDILAKTTTSSNTNITQLADAFNYLGPTAKSLGISLEESAAAVGTLANSGLKGSLATRALGTALVSLTDPTKKARGEISKIGLSAFDSEGNFVGLANVVGQLEQAYAGYTDEQKQASIAAIFGKEAVQEINILLSKGSTELSKYTSEIKAAGDQQGAFAQQIRDTKLATFEGSLRLLSSAWEELQLTLASGSLDFLAGATRGLADGVRGIAEIIKGNLDFGDVFGPVGDQFDQLFATISNTASRVINALAPIGGLITGTFGVIPDLIGAIVVPSITALSFWIDTLGSVLTPVIATFSSFIGIAGNAVGFLAQYPGVIAGVVTGLSLLQLNAALSGLSITKLATSFKSLQIVQLASAASSKVIAAAQVAYSTVTGLLTGKIKLLAVAQRALNIVLADNPIGIVITAISLAVGAIVTLYNESETARRIIDNAWKGIKDAISRAIDSVKVRLQGLGEIFTGIFEFDTAKIASGLTKVVTASTEAAEKVAGAFTKKVEANGANIKLIDSASSLVELDKIGARAETVAGSVPLVFRAGFKEAERAGQGYASFLDFDKNAISANLSTGVKEGVSESLTQLQKLQGELARLNEQKIVLAESGNEKGLRAVINQISATESSIKKLQRTNSNTDLSGPPAAARGSYQALNDELTTLGKKLATAAPTANTASIQKQIADVGRDIAQLQLSRVGIDIDLNSRVDAADFTRIASEVQKLKKQLELEEIGINILANTGASEEEIASVQTNISNLKADIEALEGAKINIESGETRQVITGVATQIATLEEQIRRASFALPDFETNPEAFKEAQIEVGTLQNQLDRLKGFKLEIEGNGITQLEARLNAVNAAIKSIPTSNTAFSALKDQARDLANQINQVNVFKVLADVDAGIPELEHTLSVLRERLASPPEGEFLPGLIAQIAEVKARIAELKPAIESLDLQPIKVPPVEIGAIPAPDFTAAIESFNQYKGATSAVAEEIKRDWQNLVTDIGSLAKDTLINTGLQFVQDIGRVIGESMQPIRDENGDTVTDLEAQLQQLQGQLAQSPNSAFADEIESQMDGIKAKIKEMNAQKFTFGDALAAALQSLVSTFLVEVPKMIGLFLMDTGLKWGFPAGVPPFVAGVALLGFSGLIGGLLGGGRNRQQVASAPTASQVAAQGSSAATRTGAGLSSFQASEETRTTVVNLTNVLDVDGIRETLSEQIIRDEINATGR